MLQHQLEKFERSCFVVLETDTDNKEKRVGFYSTYSELAFHYREGHWALDFTKSYKLSRKNIRAVEEAFNAISHHEVKEWSKHHLEFKIKMEELNIECRNMEELEKPFIKTMFNYSDAKLRIMTAKQIIEDFRRHMKEDWSDHLTVTAQLNKFDDLLHSFEEEWKELNEVIDIKKRSLSFVGKLAVRKQMKLAAARLHHYQHEIKSVKKHTVEVKLK